MKHINFAQELLLTTGEFSPPVRSLLDVDFYKFTMGQLIFRNFRDVQVTFQLIIRDPTIPVMRYVYETELRKMLDYAMGLRFTTTDLIYLRGMDIYGRNMFTEEYLDFLRAFKLPSYQLKVSGNQIELTFAGSWPEVSHWETIALAIISELYYRRLLLEAGPVEAEKVYIKAQARLLEKLEKLAAHPGIRFADFAQRRRHSFRWQEWAIGLARSVMGEQFTGASNTWMAFRHNVIPIGTNAHELPMVLTALADSEEEMKYAQYRVLELWQEMYGQGLRVFLPDTYGSTQFLANAPSWVATWRGMRQDSGDPIEEGKKYMKWLEAHGVDPKERIMIASDGLDVDSMIKIDNYFGDKLPHPFGWGTMFGNDFGGLSHKHPNLRPFSVVCKVVKANDRPVVKLSNNPNKATGPKEEVERYKKIFGVEGQAAERVLV